MSTGKGADWVDREPQMNADKHKMKSGESNHRKNANNLSVLHR